jgi:pyridoxal phosphate enzyme (YggS family)
VTDFAASANDVKSRIGSNLESVRKRIADAARRSGRDPDDILLVAVAKMVGVPEILCAADLGVDIIGENRVRETAAKRDRVGDRVKWHMVGHLQRRKVRDAVSIFDHIHSVDSLALAEEIDKRCVAAGKTMPVLFEVNVSGEETKSGLSPDETPGVIRQAAALEHIRIEGLMTMAPLVPDPEEARPCFRELARLAESVEREGTPNVTLKHLSMGMTNDFEVAIEEGSTMVRVGTAIFGADR